MLKELIKAKVPAILIRTSEEIRVEEVLSSIVQDLYDDALMLLWTPIKTIYYSSEDDKTYDIVPHKDFDSTINYDNLLRVLKADKVKTKANIFVFYGIKHVLNSHIRGLSYESIYKVIELIRRIKKSGDTVIFVGSSSDLPDELSKLFYVYDMPLPTVNEIEDVFKSVTMEYISFLQDKAAMKKLLAKIPKAAQLSQGLTLEEAEAAFTRSLQVHNDIDFSLLIKHKASAVAQSEVLEVVDIKHFPIENVIGFTALKKWLELRKLAFGKKASKYNLEKPKGIILVGHSGCGKSMISKAVGNMLDLPVIRFDFSRVGRSLLGDSEELMERTLLTLDAIGSCVCWIDEINLSMGGASSSSINDSGVMLKLLQMFLSWQQEKSKVFIVATANDLETLPPMLYRKGRMDGIWFCGLPDTKNRMELFKTHLSLKHFNPEDFNLGILAGSTDKFSGAEIEHSIKDAMFLAASKDEKLSDKHLLEAIKTISPNTLFFGENFTKVKKEFQKIGVLDAETGLPLSIQ